MTRSIKTILVSLNNDQFFDNNMAMAAQIAREYDSHIIGLYVIPSIIVHDAPYGYGGPISFSQMKEFYTSKAGGIEQSFRDFISKENLNGEWREISSDGHLISEAIIDHGRESDLIILGDDNSIDPEVPFQARIVQKTGRPVLIVPNMAGLDFSLSKAIIGWDGSREAARAAFDAVPLLQMASSVEVTCYNAHREREISGDTPGSELAKSLARHDVSAVVVFVKTRKSVAKALMARAETADLLVMGAYGHSRLMEEIFGGVTNEALTRMPCPVLMST